MAEEPEEKVIEVTGEIMQSAEFSEEQIQEDLHQISEVMGDYLFNLIGTKISDLGTLYTIHYLADSLAYFEKNETLDRQIERFDTQQEAMSHLSTLYFARYILGEAGEITFEPNRGDIILEWENRQVTFEFKMPRESEEITEYREKHREIIEELKPVMDSEFQYDIMFENGQDMDVLPSLIEPILEDLNSPGKTRPIDTIEVNVTDSGGYNENPFVDHIVLPGTVQDLDSGDWMPQTHYGGSEGTFSIAGPKVKETEKIKNIIKGARKQLSTETPNIVVVHIGQLMGSISDFKRTTESIFSANKNTRLNAVVLWDYQLHDGDIEATTRIVHNPFSDLELDEEFFENIPKLEGEVITE